MWIRKVEIKEHYKSADGDRATLTQTPDGTATLTIRDADGQIIVCRKYASRKGAAVALGRRGKWEFVFMTESFRKAKTKGRLHQRCAR